MLLFVHGGAWRHGDKTFMGVYGALGTFFARHGYGTPSPQETASKGPAAAGRSLRSGRQALS